MNIIDIIALIPLAYFGFIGYKKGIVKELFGLAALILAIVATLKTSHYILTQLSANTDLESPYLPLIVYVLVFLAAFVLVILMGRLVEKVIKAAQLNFLNRFFGLVLGLVKALLLVSLFVWLVDNAALFDDVVKKESISYKYIKDFTPIVVDALGAVIPWFHDLVSSIEDYFSKIVQQLDTTH